VRKEPTVFQDARSPATQPGFGSQAVTCSLVATRIARCPKRGAIRQAEPGATNSSATLAGDLGPGPGQYRCNPSQTDDPALHSSCGACS